MRRAVVVEGIRNVRESSSIRSGFPSRSKRRGRKGPAISCSLRWNYWRSWQLWSHRPGSISCAITGSWPPVPGTAAASCPPSRLRHRRWRPRFERSALRPSPGVGGPARPGVCRRPQRLPGLWRSPSDRGRPDRSRLDPDLSGGGRTAGGAPASVAVRVRRLTTSAIGCRRR